MSSSEAQMRDFFPQIIEEVGVKQWFEYVRKLGLSESDIQNEWEHTGEISEKKHKMLVTWSNYMGRFDEQQRRILNEVKRELHGPRRMIDNNLGEKLLTTRTPKKPLVIESLFYREELFLASRNIYDRDKAWLIYLFLQFYSAHSVWMKIVREKMGIAEHEIQQIQRDFGGNISEQKFQMVLTWCKRTNRYTVQDIVHGFRDLEAYVPEEFDFILQQVQPENNGQDQVDGSVSEGPATCSVNSAILSQPSAQNPPQDCCLMFSYSHEHSEVPRQIATSINESPDLNFKVWIDVNDMHGRLCDSMADAVKQCNIFLMFISKAYQDSENCRKEAISASNKNKPIIPIKVEDFKPENWLDHIMEDRKYFDFTKHPFEEEFNALLKEISIYMR